MTTVFDPRLASSPSFEPLDMRLQETSLDQDICAAARATVNLGLMVVNLQRETEKRQDVKIEEKIAEVNELHGRIETFTALLESIEADLGKKEVKKISLREREELVAQARELFPNELLNKPELTREEGELLNRTLGRRVEQLSREISPKMTAVNHLIEERHDMLQTIREILKMYREMLQGMARNQRIG